MNGAAESLLAELVELQKGQAETLKAMASKMGANTGGDATGGAGTKFKMAGDAAATLGKGFGVVSGILTGVFGVALNLASVGLNALKDTGQALWANQKALSEGAIAGTNSLASLTQGLEKLPFGLGLVAQAMTYQNKVLEQNLKTYQEISQVGAAFGGSMDAAREAAKGMGLSMDEFARTMKNNAPYLLSFGATADQGAENLVKFNKQFVMGKEGLGRSLLGMGYTIEEANNALATYAAGMGGVTREQMANQGQMETSVVAFATELQLSAELEGKSRKQAEDELKAKQANAIRENMLARMTSEEKLEFQAAENRARLLYGKDGENAVLATYAKMPSLLDKGGRTVMALAGNDIKKITDNIGGPVEQHAQRMTGINKTYAAAADAQQKFVQGNRTLLMSQAGSNSALAGMSQAALLNEKRAINNGLKNEADQLKLLTDEQKSIEKRKTSDAADAALAQARAKYAGDLMNLLTKILQPFFPIITKLLNTFVELAPKIAEFVEGLVSVITGVFDDLFGGMTMDDFIKPFKDFWKGLFGDSGGLDFASVRKSISDFFKPIVTFIGNAFKAIDFEAVGKKVRETFGRVFASLGVITDALSKAFEGGKGESLGKWLGDTFGKLMDIIGGLAEAIGSIIAMWVKTPAFAMMKEMFNQLVKIIGGIVDILLEIVKGPVGTWLVGALSAAIEFFLMPWKFLFDVVDAAVDIIMGIIKMFNGEFNVGLDMIGNGIKTFLKGMVDKFERGFQLILKLFGFESEITDIKAWADKLIDGLIEGITGFIGGIVSFFSSKSDKKPDAKTESKVETKAESKPEAKKEAAPAGPEKTPVEKKAPSGAEVKPTPPSTANKEETPQLDPSAMKSTDPTEILKAEIVLLNKQTALMLSAMRENRDWSRTTAEKINAFGNKFKG